MTQKQIERLCKCDPEHFERTKNTPGAIFLWSECGNHDRLTTVVARFDKNGAPDERHPIFLGSCLWWMLEQLPDVLFSVGPPDSGPPRRYCEDGRLDRFSGDGETAEDAVIDAYCQFKEEEKR